MKRLGVPDAEIAVQPVERPPAGKREIDIEARKLAPGDVGFLAPGKGCERHGRVDVVKAGEARAEPCDCVDDFDSVGNVGADDYGIGVGDRLRHASNLATLA